MPIPKRHRVVRRKRRKPRDEMMDTTVPGQRSRSRADRQPRAAGGGAGGWGGAGGAGGWGGAGSAASGLAGGAGAIPPGILKAVTGHADGGAVDDPESVMAEQARTDAMLRMRRKLHGTSTGTSTAAPSRAAMEPLPRDEPNANFKRRYGAWETEPGGGSAPRGYATKMEDFPLYPDPDVSDAQVDRAYGERRAHGGRRR